MAGVTHLPGIVEQIRRLRPTQTRQFLTKIQRILIYSVQVTSMMFSLLNVRNLVLLVSPATLKVRKVVGACNVATYVDHGVH